MSQCECVEYDGYIWRGYPNSKRRSDRVYYKKTFKKQPKYLHRYIWEKYNGEIPKNCHIHHKNENYNDNTIETLVCLTVKEHKNEIIIGGIVIAVSVGACVGFKIVSDDKIKELAEKVAKNGKIALEALRLHIDGIDNDIFALQESIDRLDPESPINKFHKIPERLAKIEELELAKSAIMKRIAEIEE